MITPRLAATALVASMRRLFNPRPQNPRVAIVVPISVSLTRRSLSAALAQLNDTTILGLLPTGPLPPPVRSMALAAWADRRVCWMRTSHDLPKTVSLVLLVAPDATLADGALANLRAPAAAEPEIDLVYADEDWIETADLPPRPYYKPAWSIDLALEQDLVGGACLVRRSLLDGCEPWRPGSPPHEVILRLAGQLKQVRHVAAIASHRTVKPGLPPNPDLLVQLLAAWPAGPSRPRLVPSPYGRRQRVQWVLETPPRVSVLVPTRDRADLLARCVDGLLHRTDYPDLELLIADNDSELPATHHLFDRLRQDKRVRILPMPGPFNYAAINNDAAAAATGEILLLMNNDVAVIDPAWLRELVGHAVRPDVGAVGARLLFEDRRIQHAGVVLGVGAFEGGPGVAGHFGLAASAADEGHGGQFVLTREVSAVTGACLALRRRVFLESGGLDAVDLTIALNDLDLCLKLRQRGYRVIYTPFAELYHLESASRGPDDTQATAERFRRECRTIRNRWGPVLDADPFYNPAFSRFDHSFQLARPSQE